MTVETFEFTGAASTNHYLAIFNTDGEVFDWDDETFKALGSATEPYLLATQLAGMGGSAKSGYVAEVDLAILNPTADDAKFYSEWFTDTALTTRVSETEEFTVTSGAIGTALVSPRLVQAGLAVDEAGTLKIMAHITQDGVAVPIASGSCAVVCYVDDTAIAVFSASSSTVLNGYRFYVSHALAAVAGSGYTLKITITDQDGVITVGTITAGAY